MSLRAAADILFRGLIPLFAETFSAVFSARIFAQRARVAAAILALPAADICRVGRAVDSATLGTDIPRPVSAPNSVNTCCSLEISARTSVTMLSLLNMRSCRRCDREE